ncbi:glycosyltransferase [Paraburkholderia caledonica]|uniref:glycosyltransferase n=1 Tax=Paraburkholderia caledonica TaxID=134536 RepID=UPI0038B76664
MMNGPNRKIANLSNILDHAEHDVLCFADSDVRVGPSFLRDIMGARTDPAQTAFEELDNLVEFTRCANAAYPLPLRVRFHYYASAANHVQVSGRIADSSRGLLRQH